MFGRRFGLGLLGLGAILGVASIALAGGSRHSCRTVEGSFHLETYTDGCDSMQGLCGRVRWEGDLRAASEFVATSYVPTVDTAVTAVALVTGDAVLDFGRRGTLRTKDAVVWRSVGAGDFAEVDTIVGGTGNFSEATGAWRAWGTLQGTSGRGHHEGEICY